MRNWRKTGVTLTVAPATPGACAALASAAQPDVVSCGGGFDIVFADPTTSCGPAASGSA